MALYKYEGKGRQRDPAYKCIMKNLHITTFILKLLIALKVTPLNLINY